MTSISFRTALRGQIFVAIGALGAAAAMGCGDDTGSGGSGAGGGAGGGGQGAQAPGGGGNGGSSDGGSPIAGGGGAGGLGQGGDNEGGGGEGEQNVERCFTNLNPDAECPSLADAAGVYPCTDLGEVVGAWLSGPAEQDTLCCYQVDVGPDNDPDCGAVGRPLVVDERAQRAGVRGARDPRRAWGAASSVAPDVSRLSLGERALLARAWARDATYEHASVASFSKFALELLACGAPAELLRGAHEAALDEVRHAELAFSLASAYAGRSLEPARLEAAARVECARTPEALIEAVIAEGCVGETLAAIVASAQHEAATDVGVRAALAVIARDEAQHAELAWRTVAWAIDALGDGLKVTAQRAFERAIEQAMNATAPDEAALHAHGRLSSDEARFERHRAVREIVVPSAAALLRV